MRTAALAAEMRQAAEALSPAQRDRLIALGINQTDVDMGMVGVARVRGAGGLYAPDPDGKSAYVTPVRVRSCITPETINPESWCRLGDLVDLVAWHPACPDRWALRVGSAEWIGCIGPQYVDPDPVAVRRNVLSWLRAGCDGIVPLTNSRLDVYRVLSGIRHIQPEDRGHLDVLKRILEQPWPTPKITLPTTGARP